MILIRVLLPKIIPHHLCGSARRSGEVREIDSHDIGDVQVKPNSKQVN
jgi:hypothetical protein